MRYEKASGYFDKSMVRIIALGTVNRLINIMAAIAQGATGTRLDR